MIERVHLVFKTHLDIGFTDLAKNTVTRYLEEFIPKAVKVSRQLEAMGAAEQLHWTTGSWLIKRYLEHAQGSELASALDAIEKGVITWHALPFTTHTELMSKELFTYGLSLSRDLDRRFGHNTIAAKMTDVPGHTVAIVPLLAKAGVTFLHIGVNGGTPVPNLPPVFRWRAETGEEVIVQYDGSYGASGAIEGCPDLLHIENSLDNAGPPSLREVLDTYERLRKQYPHAEIVASDLSEYARHLTTYRTHLPVVTSEIGDTWIHGVGTDPKKVALLRELLRFVERNPSLQTDPTVMEPLLLVCEHTWGLDFKKYLADYTSYTVKDLAAARKKDTVGPDAIPKKYAFIENHAQEELKATFGPNDRRKDHRSYSFFTSSHEEQREYINQALQALAPEQRKIVAEGMKSGIRTGSPAARLEADTPVTIGSSTLRFGADGALVSYRRNGKEFAGGEGIGVYRYERFGADEYEAYHHQYNRNFEQGKFWILGDFGKPGLELVNPKVVHRLYPGVLADLTLHHNENEVMIIASLQRGANVPESAPGRVTIAYFFTLDGILRRITLEWSGKRASRIPEALWLSVGLANTAGGTWRMSKLSTLIPMDDVVSKGSRSLHAVESLHYQSGNEALTITNLDSPLVAPSKRKLLEFDDRLPSMDGLFHFNLYNNKWNTNFRLWYDEDGQSTLIFTSDHFF